MPAFQKVRVAAADAPGAQLWSSAPESTKPSDKFGEELKRLAIPEWKAKYLDYAALMHFVDKDIRPAENSMFANGPIADEHADNFWTLLASEMTKVDDFAQQEIQRINSWHYVLKEQVEEMKAKFKIKVRRRSSNIDIDFPEDSSVTSPPVRDTTTVDVPWYKGLCGRNPEKLAIDKLRILMEESYREMDMIKSFIELNKKATRKIKKKHEKYQPNDKDVMDVGSIKLLSFSAAFEQERMRMVRWTEATFIEVLEKGDRQKAMRKLHVTHEQFQPINWSQVRVGMLLGGSFIMIIIIIIAASILNPVSPDDFTDHIDTNETTSSDPNSTSWPTEYDSFGRHKGKMFEMFGGLITPVISMLLIGVNLHVFADKGINYVLIFNMNPKSKTSAVRSKVIETGSYLLFAWSLLFISFLFWPYQETLPTVWIPFTMIMVLLVSLLDPIGWISTGKFMWLPRVVGRIITSPLFAVRFPDFWLADQMCSLTFSIQCLVRAVHFMVHGFGPEPYITDDDAALQASVAFFGALPYIFRFLQCLRRYRDEDNSAYPHLMNAGKYFTSLCVVLTGTLYKWYDSDAGLVFYILLAITSMSYSFYWDIYHDWGLTIFGSKVRPGNTNMYALWKYNAAVVIDLVLRLSWTISLSLHLAEDKIGPVGGTVKIFLAIVEVCRRFMWNFLRLENEHLNNCGRYRATKEIAVPFEYLSSRAMELGSYHEAEHGAADVATVKKLLAASQWKASLALIVEGGVSDIVSEEQSAIARKKSKKITKQSAEFMARPTGRKTSTGADITWGDELNAEEEASASAAPAVPALMAIEQLLMQSKASASDDSEVGIEAISIEQNVPEV